MPKRILFLVVWLHMGACGPRVAVCEDDCESSSTTGDEPVEASTATNPTPDVGGDDDVLDTGSDGSDPGTLTMTTATTADTTSADESSTGDIGPSVMPGDPTPCLVGGNMFILDGDPQDYVHAGSLVLDDADWAFSQSGDPIDVVLIDVTTERGMGEWWYVWFATDAIPAPLAVGHYPDAMREPFEDPGHPGLWIAGNGAGCNMIGGQFEIHDLEIVDGTIQRITATWEQFCELGPHALRGCVHWEGE